MVALPQKTTAKFIARAWLSRKIFPDTSQATSGYRDNPCKKRSCPKAPGEKGPKANLDVNDAGKLISEGNRMKIGGEILVFQIFVGDIFFFFSNYHLFPKKYWFALYRRIWYIYSNSCPKQKNLYISLRRLTQFLFYCFKTFRNQLPSLMIYIWFDLRSVGCPQLVPFSDIKYAR